MKLVRALRKGWIKREEAPEKPEAYLIWEDDGEVAAGWWQSGPAGGCVGFHAYACVALCVRYSGGFDASLRLLTRRPPASLLPARCRQDAGQDGHGPDVHPRAQAQAAGPRGVVQPAQGVPAQRGGWRWCVCACVCTHECAAVCLRVRERERERERVPWLRMAAPDTLRQRHAKALTR